MPNSTNDEQFWTKIKDKARLYRNADEDLADIYLDNLIVFINSTMTRNSAIHQHTEQAVRRAEAKGRLAAINSIKAWADRVETSYNDMMLKEVRHVTQLATNPKGE